MLQIDVERRTTRGRVCPVCGGKIIPSHRAVYESKAIRMPSFPVAMRTFAATKSFHRNRRSWGRNN
jgi:hypothetical protein